jgi:hypothetical protein
MVAEAILTGTEAHFRRGLHVHKWNIVVCLGCMCLDGHQLQGMVAFLIDELTFSRADSFSSRRRRLRSLAFALCAALLASSRS